MEQTHLQVAEAINQLCNIGPAAALASDPSVDPDLLERRSKQLLEFSKAVQKLKNSKNVAKPAVGRRIGSHDARDVAGIRYSRVQVGQWADHAPEKQSRLKHRFADLGMAFLIVCCTIPYYVCVGYTAWFVDEGFAIYRNPDARGETPILEVLRHDFWGTSLNPPEGYNTHKSYRPLITLSYALEWQLGRKAGYEGLEMRPMRFLSCLVHTANAQVVLILLRRLMLPRMWALLGAGLFAVHPIHVENIVYLVGRADALATLFSLLSVLLYLRWTTGFTPRLPLYIYLLLVVLASLAGLCKETGFTVLFFLACAEVVLRTRWVHFFGLLSSFAIVAGVRTWYVGGTEAGFGYVDTPIRYMDSQWTRTLSYLNQHAYSAKLLVLPWHQAWDYSYDALPMVESLTDLRVLTIAASYLAVVAIAASGLRSSVQRPSIILGLGMVVIPFVPASNLFFLVGTTVGERLLYPSTVGWSVLVASIGLSRRRCASKRHRGGKTKERALFVLFFGLFGVYLNNSVQRMENWRSTRQLFETDAKHWSRSVKVVHSQASELQARHDLEGALELYLKSLSIFDDQAITDYCIARIYINLGRYQEALARFVKILNGHGIGFHDGNDFLWMTDLGYLSVQIGENDQGIQYLKDGLQRMPYQCYAWNALGVAYLRRQKLPEAVESLMECLQCDPETVSAWVNLATAYAYDHQPAQALEALQRAAQLDPEHAVLAHNQKVLSGRGFPGELPQTDLYIPLPGRR